MNNNPYRAAPKLIAQCGYGHVHKNEEAVNHYCLIDDCIDGFGDYPKDPKRLIMLVEEVVMDNEISYRTNAMSKSKAKPKWRIQKVWDRWWHKPPRTVYRTQKRGWFFWNTLQTYTNYEQALMAIERLIDAERNPLPKLREPEYLVPKSKVVWTDVD